MCMGPMLVAAFATWSLSVHHLVPFPGILVAVLEAGSARTLPFCLTKNQILHTSFALQIPTRPRINPVGQFEIGMMSPSYPCAEFNFLYFTDRGLQPVRQLLHKLTQTIEMGFAKREVKVRQLASEFGKNFEYRRHSHEKNRPRSI
jgi:hypothetical protein